MGGLIYVVIMAVWAVVLVPAWLRRHDHEDPSRSVDRWSRSMRLLAKPPTVSMAAAQREAETPVESARPEVRVVSRPAPSRARAVRERTQPSRAAKRRRVVLGSLVGLLVVLGGLATIGLVPAFVLAVPIVLIASFVAVARAQVRVTDRAREARLAAAPRPTTTVAPSTRGRARPGIHADGTWDAQPSPLPSYVTAPPASSVPRVIDTETPGAWTAAAMLERVEQERRRAERLEQARLEAVARARAEQAAAEARTRDEEYLAQQAAPNLRVIRRAVNE